MKVMVVGSMRFSIIGLIMLVLVAYSNSAYAEDIKLKTVEGVKVNFRLSRHMPLPVENDWVKITTAGFSFSTGNSEIPATLSWAFGFETKRNDIVKVQVYDVTNSVKLLLEDKNVVIKKNEWSKLGEPITITKDKFPWLYDKKLSSLIYKFIIENEKGESLIAYQLGLYPKNFDEQISKFIK
jgi:hypothetical protein